MNGNGAQTDGTITGTQSKAADRYAIEVLKIPSLQLMETASAAVADYISEKYAGGSSVLICCGAGNNGADGVCIGRMLLEKDYRVRVIVFSASGRQTEEFDVQMKRYLETGGTAETYAGETSFGEADVLVDAVFGIGLHRPIAGKYLDFVNAAEATARHETVAVDIPSGINSDTGERMGAGIRADVTVTFGRNKTGLTAGDGKIYAGRVLVKDIGIPAEAYRKAAAGES